jgi:hypothetical protein
MPMIEGKKFPYTKAGKAAAKKYAAKHEKTESKREREMEYGKPKKGKGGRVEVGGPGWREINKKKKK